MGAAAQKKTAARRPAAAPSHIDVFDDVSLPCTELAARDRALKKGLEAIGRPHIRRRSGGFPGLFRIIVEQQVSVPSAQAIWSRCEAQFAPLTPTLIVAAGEGALRRAGLSSPKARYVLGLAAALEAGALDLDTAGLADEAASERLRTVKGIGPWTASIYLLFCEGRLDIWPPNDVALLRAYDAARGVKGTQRQLDARAEKWSPWRGVAAHILWTYYAHLRGRTPI
jgi:DNA-3-methyladenine glycosylase II